jgi:hypothetical protein
MTDADALQTAQEYLADEGGASLLPKPVVARLLTLATSSVALATTLDAAAQRVAELSNDARMWREFADHAVTTDWTMNDDREVTVRVIMNSPEAARRVAELVRLAPSSHPRV